MRNWRAGEEPEYRRKREHAAQHETEANRYKNAISTIVGIGTVIDRVAATHEARYNQTNAHENARKKREYGTIAALVLAAAVATWGIIQSHSDTRKALRDARTAAAQQHTDTIAALSKTDAQIATLQTQTGIMRGQLDEMHKALVMEQRPWLYFVGGIEPIVGGPRVG
jgi:hypothetical protein